MTRLRVGTRGSDLALWQTGWVCDRLAEQHADLELEQVIIRTHGDLVTDRNFGKDWPVGAFVSALENALLEERVDIAVHSFKDLQTAATAGLAISATPPRAAVHDVLLTREPMTLTEIPEGARIGTNSPRRAAQLLQLGKFFIVPIRGNVPTRINKMEREGLHGVMLAAAGLERLGVDWPHRIDLSVTDMIPAPAQGALAVQTRCDGAAARLVATLDHHETRRCVTAERSFLATINAGCHTPVGALARVEGDGVRLHARLFTDDYVRFVEGVEQDRDAQACGERLAHRLLRELEAGGCASG